MFLAVLEFTDFLLLGVLIYLLMGGTAVASRRSAGDAAAEERLCRMEDKLNVLLTHMGIDYVPRTKERWQRLADESNQEKAAEEYSEAHSVPLEEAKRVVEQYVADHRGST